MTAESLFSVCNLLVLPGWLLLAVFPAWRWTQRLVPEFLTLLLSLCYLFLLLASLPQASGNFASLAGLGEMLRDPSLLLAGWIHYLAFDLFVGSWEVRDARRLRIPHVAVIPSLILTFLLGPAGWLTYYLLRVVTRRELEVEEA